MQSETSTEKLSHDDILVLRDTAETAGAVAHLAAARLYALMTRDMDEPGVDLIWFDHRGDYAERASGADNTEQLHADVTQRITRLANYVATREVRKGEQLYRFDGGRRWESESEPYRQAMELFCSATLIAASGIELRKAAIAMSEQHAKALKDHKPLKLEDSIFQPDEGMGALLPHAVEASQAMAKSARGGAAPSEGEPKQTEALSVGEPPVGHAKRAKPAKDAKAKKAN